MKKVFSFLFAVAPAISLYAGQPANSIGLRNSTGATVNQPYIISRFFAKGEIPHYAQPEGIAQWQNNVKTRWPDGSVQHVLVSFWKSTANGTTDTIRFVDSADVCYLGGQAVCDAAALDGAGMLSFNNNNWGAAMQATNGTTYTTDARDLIARGFYTYWVRGPIATVAVVEDRTTNRSMDFGWTCKDTYRVVADPTTDTLATYDYSTGTNAVAHGFANGKKLLFGVVTTNAGPAPLLSSGKLSAYRYVVNATATAFKIASTVGGTPIDITTTGTADTYVTGCGTDDYSTTIRWDDDPVYRSLHPQFILTFFPGWSGVYIEYVMQNGWSTALQDERYQLKLLKDAGNTSVVRSFTLTQYARTEWVYRAWSGTPTVLEFPSSNQLFTTTVSPPNFSIDLNKQYIIYSKMVPQHDPRLTVDSDYFYSNDLTTFQGAISGAEPFYCDGSRAGSGTQYCGDYYLVMSTTGGRGDIGLNPRWYVRYLYTFDPRWHYLMVANGDLGGLPPYHVWEGATGKWYDSSHTIDAFGKPLSVNARPTVREYKFNTSWDVAVNAADHFTFIDAFPAAVGAGYSLSDSFMWMPEYGQSDPQHNPAFHYIPYLATGDYFYLQDMMAYVSQYLVRSASPTRHADWGISSSGATRGLAWSLRGILQAAVIAPDGIPEKTYYTEKLNNNLAYWEAMYGITDGNFAKSCDANTFDPSTESSPYCWSYFYKVGASARQNLWNIPLQPNDGTELTLVNGAVASAAESIFQVGFQSIVTGWGAELGYASDKIARRVGQMVTRVALTGNPRDVEQYFVPVGLKQPTAVLASNITNTALTIPLAAPPTWKVNPPFHVRIDNEWIHICSVSGSTMTACSHGRGALQASPTVMYGAAAHTAGAVVDVANHGPYVTALSDWRAAMLPQNQNFTLPMTGYNDLEHGYLTIAIAGLSFFDRMQYGGLSRLSAFQTLVGLRNAAGFSYANTYNPKFVMIPRREPVQGVQVQAGDAFAVITYRAPAAGSYDAGCTVDGVSDGQSTSRFRSVVKTGLTAGSQYTSTVHCDADYYDNGAGVGNTAVSYTTGAPLSGSGAFRITLGAGSSTAYLDYGTTAAMGSTISASCAAGCTLSATPPRGMIYYRVRRGNGGGTVTASIVQ